MEHIVKIVAPRYFGDFVFKLFVFVMICGFLNHFREVTLHGYANTRPFIENLMDATWTALPMCTLALLLIQHLNALQVRLYKQATQDSLTQIPNRRWFFDRCGARLSQGATLVLLDVDHFKKVNDAFGHDVGDTSLKAIAMHIGACLPLGAQFARLGGEEFAILFPQADTDLIPSVQMICKGTSVQLPGHGPLKITLSAGIFEAVEETNTKVAFRLADAALYQAKAAGRTQFAVADAKASQVAIRQTGHGRTSMA